MSEPPLIEYYEHSTHVVDANAVELRAVLRHLAHVLHVLVDQLDAEPYESVVVGGRAEEAAAIEAVHVPLLAIEVAKERAHKCKMQGR